MKKQNRTKALPELAVRNPVAKFAHHFNKAHVFNDKRRYRRTVKHPGREPFAIGFLESIVNGSSA